MNCIWIWKDSDLFMKVENMDWSAKSPFCLEIFIKNQKMCSKRTAQIFIQSEFQREENIGRK